MSSVERGQATRSSLELACDKFLDHPMRLVGLRTRFRDPFVNRIFEQAIVALAAGGTGGTIDADYRAVTVPSCVIHLEPAHPMGIPRVVACPTAEPAASGLGRIGQ